MKNKIAYKVGQNVRKHREKKNLSQAQLGARLNYRQPYISRIESGQYKMFSFARLNRIAEAIGVPMRRLFDGL